MDSNFANTPKKKNKVQKSQNFIEAIKDVGDSLGSQIKDIGGGVAKGAINSILGQSPDQNPSQTAPSPNQEKNFNFEEYLYNRERQVRAQERGLSQRIRDNEKVIYNRREEETKQQIVCVQEEIKKIIVETKGLAIELIEAEKTVSTQVVGAGKYHLNFFDRVKRLLVIARKRIAESKDWLALFNSRKNRKNLYWNKVQKSGTKFMLSSERYMATQAG